MNPLQRALEALLDFQIKHPRLVVFLAVALAVLSVYYTIGHLGFQTAQKDLISPHNRLLRLSEQIEPFDSLDKYAVVIEGNTPQRSLAFLHTLVPRIEKNKKDFQQIFYRVDPDRFRPWALLYLDHQELVELRDNLQQHRNMLQQLLRHPDLSGFFQAVNHEMASRMVGELFTGFLETKPAKPTQKDKPLNLDFLISVLSQMNQWANGQQRFTSPWQALLTGGENESQEGYFWTHGKRFLLLFVTPTSGGGFNQSEEALTALRQTIASVGKGFPGVRVGVTGQEALNADEMSAAMADMSLATLLSLAGLTILLVLFWRGWRRPFLEMIELILALAWTFGLTTLFIGHLNILSVTFAPLLLGLGIDYGIHWFARYQEEERLRGGGQEEIIRITMRRLGPGILLAGLTAALSFFPLVLTNFKGLVELGKITSMGMVMTTISTMVVLPCLTLLFDRGPRRQPGESALQPHKPLLRLTNGRALLILLPALLALGVSVWSALGVRFDLNMLNLQSRHAESVIWEKKLIAGSKRSSMYGAVLAHSLPELAKKSRELAALPAVSEVQSVLSLLPAHQQEKIALLHKMQPLLTGVHPVALSTSPVNLSALNGILGRIRFKMADTSATDWGASKPLASQMRRVRRLIDRLRSRVAAGNRPALEKGLEGFQKALFVDLNKKLDLLQRNVAATPMHIDDLPAQVRRRFVGKNHLYLIRVFPAENIWEPQYLGRFVHELQSVDPNAVGDPVTLYIFTKAFRDACIKAALYAVVFIFVLLLFSLRRLGDTLLAVTPLVAGTAWTFGLMRLFGIHFNLANSLFLPLVVGAGVEYGIIILQRWRQDGQIGRDVALPYSTAKGVILAGLTTTVGFCSLTISDHQGIHSLGLLATFGSLSILVAAILFLPALLQLSRRLLRPQKVENSLIQPDENVSDKQERS